jgi:hypothetical protein
MTNILKNFKIWFVTVPNLIQLYNQQNALAVQAAGETARNQTSVNLKNMEINAEERAAVRREAQAQKLQEFQQLMENLRQQRDIGSREKLGLAQLASEDARATLGRETTVSENSKQRELEKALSVYRENQQTEREKLSTPLREAQAENLRTESEVRRAMAPSQIARSEAEAKLTGAQADVLGQPDVDSIIQSVSKLTTDKETQKVLKKSLGENGYKSLLSSLTSQLTAKGVDPNSVPGVAEKAVEGAKERYAALATELPAFVDQQIKNGVEQKFNERLVILQNRIASGAYSNDQIKQARQLLVSWGKQNGVSKDTLSQI